MPPHRELDTRCMNASEFAEWNSPSLLLLLKLPAKMLLLRVGGLESTLGAGKQAEGSQHKPLLLRPEAFSMVFPVSPSDCSPCLMH